MKFRAAWTWPWGPYFVVISVTAIIISKLHRPLHCHTVPPDRSFAQSKDGRQCYPSSL